MWVHADLVRDCRERASNVRWLAQSTSDIQMRETLLRLVDAYENAAEVAERQAPAPDAK
ncbi:MAG: hypothetical protein ACM30I_01790 [Gemmatimonas sp.]